MSFEFRVLAKRWRSMLCQESKPKLISRQLLKAEVDPEDEGSCLRVGRKVHASGAGFAATI